MMRSAFSRHFLETFPDLVGTRILVALSGGPDSVALLHLLRDPRLGLDLHAAHVHHGVRGPEADGDAEFCRGLCGSLGVPFHLERLTPPRRPPEGREAAWRRLRYAALREMARKVDARAIATGHQRDDVAEGVLVQLLRGAGLRAMAGIAARTSGGIIRPLLPWTRREILGWLEAQGLRWREDSSNRSPEHLRNRVRGELLPLARDLAPRIRDHLGAVAGDLARDEEHFARELEKLGLWIDPWDPDGGVEIERLGSLDGALLPRWLHAQVARSGLGKATRRQAELLEALVRRGSPRAVTLAGRWRLYRARGRLWLAPPRDPEPYRAALHAGSVVELPLPGWTVRVETDGAVGPAGDGRGFRCRVPASLDLEVRSPRSGDRVGEGDAVRPLAALLRHRLPRHLRGAWPVIHGGATIVWVPGIWTAPGLRGGDVLDVEVRRR